MILINQNTRYNAAIGRVLEIQFGTRMKRVGRMNTDDFDKSKFRIQCSHWSGIRNTIWHTDETGWRDEHGWFW